MEISEERIRRLLDYLPLLPEDSELELKNEVIKLAVQVAASPRVTFRPNEVEGFEASKLTVLAAGLAAKFLQEPQNLAEFLRKTYKKKESLPAVFQSCFKVMKDWDLVSQAVAVLVNGQINQAMIREAMSPLIPAASKNGTPNHDAIEALAQKVASSYPVDYFPKVADQLFGSKKTVLAVGLAASFLLQSAQGNVTDFLENKKLTEPTQFPATFRFLFTPKHTSDWKAVCEAVKLLISSNTKDQAQDGEFAASWFKAIQTGTKMLGDICQIVLHLAYGEDTDDCFPEYFTLHLGPSKMLHLTHPLSIDNRGTPFELVHVPRTGLVMLHAAFEEQTGEEGYVCVTAEGSTLVVQPSNHRPSLLFSFEMLPKSPNVTDVVKFHLPGKPGYYLTESNGKLSISRSPSEFALEPTVQDAWEPQGCSPECDRNQSCAHYNEECAFYCFRGDCRVLAANGELVRVSELRVGDRVRVLGGKVDVVEACVCTEVAGGVKEMVTLPNGVCLTPGHPVMTRSGQLVAVSNEEVSLAASSSEWLRPKELVAPRVEQLSHLFNFALRNRGALLVMGPEARETLDSSLVVCGSLGQNCPGVDDATSFFGSERVIASLKQNPQWPHIRGTNSLPRH